MRTLILFFGSIFLFSCENELDLSAEYDETIVVYGLLDHSQDTQYVKINKTFLGDGSALDYAQQSDSFTYRNITATLTNLSNSNNVITLQAYDAPKEPGLFSHKENLVYITDEELVGGNKYRLDVTNNNTGERATATTQVIDTIILKAPLSLQTVNFRSVNTYKPERVAYSALPNIFRYEVTMIFTFVEVNKLDNSIRTVKKIMYPLGTKFLSESENSEITYLIDGESFFSKIAEVVSIDQTVDREIGGIQFITHGASEELQLYINANGPLDGISQVRPEYSNIENGYGLFASKIVHSSQLWTLGNYTQNFLINGSYTKNLGFKYP